MTTLTKLRDSAAECTRCDLYQRATQTVFGEGKAWAPIALIGEQPGDQEDKQGHPFVGPAGRLLDRALAEAGIDRDDVYDQRGQALQVDRAGQTPDTPAPGRSGEFAPIESYAVIGGRRVGGARSARQSHRLVDRAGDGLAALFAALLHPRDGHVPDTETELRLRGYQDSGPARAGNRATGQPQWGSYGDLLECMWLAVDRTRAHLDPASADLLGNHVCDIWTQPDCGIWELDKRQHNTFSKVGCWGPWTG